MKKKGGLGIAGIFLMVIILVVLVPGLTNIFKDLFGSTNTAIASTNDHDGDRVPTNSDPCPCDPGPLDNDGCPLEYATKEEKTKRGKENRDCLEKDK